MHGTGGTYYRATGAGLCLLALMLGAGAARADQANFDFTVAGFRIGTVATSSSQSGSSFSATANVDATGLVGFFTSFFFHGKASGTVKAEGLIPLDWDGRHCHIYTMDLTPTGPVHAATGGGRHDRSVAGTAGTTPAA